MSVTIACLDCDCEWRIYGRNGVKEAGDHTALNPAHRLVKKESGDV